MGKIKNKLEQSIKKAKRVLEINLARKSNRLRFYKFKSKNKTIGPY